MSNPRGEVSKPSSGDPLPKLLVACHGHPRFSNGGGEIAAYNLYATLQARGTFDCTFLGCARLEPAQRLGATINQPFSEREFVYAANGFDWFKFSNSDPKFPSEFRALLTRVRPDVVHFHHYSNLGVEAFLYVHECLPDCAIVLTLHEFLAICHHFGQMVTRPHRTLCYRATPRQCSGCFREITPSDFFLRNLYIERFFELVDHFIAPSHFLAARYAEWGIPRAKLSVIENVIPKASGTPVLPGERDGPLRVGFFGQISALKGINVLIDSAAILENRKHDGIVIEIFGDHSAQPPEFQSEFAERLAKAGRNVVFHGPYDQARVDQLIRSVHAVVVPSIWWENSPLVIQEALRNRRPVICSDIGGMAEKVRDGLDGFHFPVGNSYALASLLAKVADSPKLLGKLATTLQSPPDAADTAAGHERLYASLM